MQQWEWGSDAEPTNELQLYDVMTGVFKAVPLEREITKLGEGCRVTVQPLGFSENGEVAVRFSAKQYFESEGEARKPLCKIKYGTWLFDSKANRITQASNNSQVPRWGKTK